MQDVLSLFAQAAEAERGLLFPDGVIANGEHHRVPTVSKPDKKNGWYVVHLNDGPGQSGVVVGVFNDLAAGQPDVKWSSTANKRPEVSIEEATAAMKKKIAEAAKVKLDKAEAAINEVTAEIAKGKPVQVAFGYLEHKGVGSVPGLYRNGSTLVVPLKDDKQRVVNMQRIWQDSEGVWQKRYQKNATRVGTYFAIKASSDTVAICEGLATGISVYEATGWTVLAAGDTTQLMAVAKMARRMMPGSQIILCADDDRMTEGNPGLTKAREAAEAVRGEVRLPVFDDLDSKGTDFNDLHQEQGLSEVKLQLEAKRVVVDDVPLPEEAPYYEEELGAEKPPGEEAWVPKGYEFTDSGAVVRLPPAKSEKPPTLVSLQPLWVAGVRVDAVDGTRSMLVKWCTPRAGEFGRFDKPQQVIVDRGTLLNARSIVALASSGFPVDSTCASEVVLYLRKSETQYLATTVRAAQEMVASVTGWHGSLDWTASSFLIGEKQAGVGCPTFENLNPELARHVGSFTVSGEASKQLVVLRDIVDQHPDMATVVAVALASPLMRVVSAPVFVLDIACESSRGKTKALLVAASVYGSPQTMRSWDTTKFALEIVANAQRGLPLLLDETQRASKPEMVQPMVYDLCNAEGKMRGKADGGVRAVSRYESLVISTGEQSISAFGDAGGARARILTIQGSPWRLPMAKPTPEAIRALTVYQSTSLDTLSDHYGHAGRLFAEKVAVLTEDERRELRARYRELVHARAVSVEELSPSHPIGSRLSTYAALIDLAGELAERWLEMKPAAWLCHERWCAMLGAGRPADVATQAMERLVAWGWSRSAQLHGHGDATKTLGRDAIGTFSVDAVTGRPQLRFVMATANDMLRSAGFQPGAVAATWASRGWLVGDKGSNTSKVVSVAGFKVRMYDLSTVVHALHVWPSEDAAPNIFGDDVPF
jgi:putative DNA primase/helicase